MSSNKSAREALERRYGAECFIEKLYLRKDGVPRRYTSKGQRKRMKQLTYHHIVERRNGGKATVENGALLSAENHAWFHKQSPQIQGYYNTIFQEYKKQVDECTVVFVDSLEVPFKVSATEISIDEDGKLINTGKYNRAKKKQEDRKLIDKYFREER